MKRGSAEHGGLGSSLAKTRSYKKYELWSWQLMCISRSRHWSFKVCRNWHVYEHEDDVPFPFAVMKKIDSKVGTQLWAENCDVYLKFFRVKVLSCSQKIEAKPCSVADWSCPECHTDQLNTKKATVITTSCLCGDILLSLFSVQIAVKFTLTCRIWKERSIFHIFRGQCSSAEKCAEGGPIIFVASTLSRSAPSRVQWVSGQKNLSVRPSLSLCYLCLSVSLTHTLSLSHGSFSPRNTGGFVYNPCSKLHHNILSLSLVGSFSQKYRWFCNPCSKLHHNSHD